MRLRSFPLLALLLVSGACAADDPPEPGGDSRFVGKWFIEETETHALYGASTYELTSDGASFTVSWSEKGLRRQVAFPAP